MTKGTLILTLTVLGLLSFAQALGQPKKLKVKGTYTHSQTKTKFLENIGDYKREGIYAFDETEKDIGATYKSGQTTLSVYLYPAGDGSDGRLRNKFIEAMQEMADVSGKSLQMQQEYKFFKKDGFKVNGFSALVLNEQKSQLTLFECGKWFFKIRISTNSLDTAQINILEKNVLNTFQPTDLVKNSPLTPKATVAVKKVAFSDSLLMSSVIRSTWTRIGWAMENVDSLERAAGFPDLHLGLHVAALKEFAKPEKKVPRYVQQSTTDYINGLNELINAGFLEEFIMEQFGMIMIVPKSETLDYDAYKNWKASHPTKIDLNQRFVTISYK